MLIARVPLHLVKWSFVQWKIKDIPTSFIWISIFFDGAAEYGDGEAFWGNAGINTDNSV
jgi:hypothetical protein